MIKLEILKDWVKNLIFIVLFTTFLEQLLPDGGMTRYVRIVMGFFIISILISPIFTLVNQNYNSIYDTFPVYSGKKYDGWEEIEREGEELSQFNQTRVKEYYESKINNRINNIINLEYPEEKTDIDVTLSEDFRIKQIKIFLRKNKTEIESIEIEPIEIGKEKTPAVNKDSPNNKYKQLEQRIGRILQIPEERIMIETGEGN